MFFVVRRAPTPRSWSRRAGEFSSASSRIRPTGSSISPTRRATARPRRTAPRSTTGARAARSSGSAALRDELREDSDRRASSSGATRRSTTARSTCSSGCSARGRGRVRLRGDPGDQQRPRADRASPHPAQPRRRRRADHHRPAARGDGWPDGVDDLVVMLDADCSFGALDPAGVEIYWGAYLGTPDELLVAGPLAEVADEIGACGRRRASARAGSWTPTCCGARARPSRGGCRGSPPRRAPARRRSTAVRRMPAASTSLRRCRPAGPRRTTSSGQLARATTAAGQSAP